MIGGARVRLTVRDADDNVTYPEGVVVAVAAGTGHTMGAGQPLPWYGLVLLQDGDTAIVRPVDLTRNTEVLSLAGPDRPTVEPPDGAALEIAHARIRELDDENAALTAQIRALQAATKARAQPKAPATRDPDAK